MTHSSNAYFMRATIAEKELASMTERARGLFDENVALTRNHVYALRVVEELATAMLTRRHRLATWVGRLIGAKDPTAESLRPMLLGIRTALSNLPAPGIVEPPANAPASEEPTDEPR